MSHALYVWAMQHGMPEGLNGDQQRVWMHQRELSLDAKIERLRAAMREIADFADVEDDDCDLDDIAISSIAIAKIALHDTAAEAAGGEK